jgi:hypothetical protein
MYTTIKTKYFEIISIVKRYKNRLILKYLPMNSQKI